MKHHSKKFKLIVKEVKMKRMMKQITKEIMVVIVGDVKINNHYQNLIPILKDQYSMNIINSIITAYEKSKRILMILKILIGSL